MLYDDDYLLIYTIIDLLCKEPTFNTALSVDLTEDFPFYGGYRTYICKPGYTFADGSTTRTVLCVYGGPDMGPKWHIDLTPCEQGNMGF